MWHVHTTMNVLSGRAPGLSNRHRDELQRRRDMLWGSDRTRSSTFACHESKRLLQSAGIVYADCSGNSFNLTPAIMHYLGNILAEFPALVTLIRRLSPRR